jgi:hypothetical protein
MFNLNNQNLCTDHQTLYTPIMMRVSEIKAMVHLYESGKFYHFEPKLVSICTWFFVHLWKIFIKLQIEARG